MLIAASAEPLMISRANHKAGLAVSLVLGIGETGRTVGWGCAVCCGCAVGCGFVASPVGFSFHCAVTVMFSAGIVSGISLSQPRKV